MSSDDVKGPVCHIGPTYPYRGGIAHYGTCLMRELARDREVRAINFSRLYPGFLFPGKTQLDESGRPFTASSERLIDSLNPFTWVRAGLRAAGMKPSLVVMQWWHPFFAPAYFTIAAVLRLARRGPVIYVCHNVLPHEKSLVDRMLAGLAFALPDAFMVQSREDLAKLARLRRGARAAVHPHPIYDFFATGGLSKAEARRLAEEPDGPLVLFFGYIRGYKGLSYLIEAMRLVRERVPARLLVVGEFYEDRAPYDALVARLGLGEAVRFVDRYVGNEEVERYFVASDLVILPYVSATQSGIVQIAFAFDRPVVVTEVGGLPEAVAPGKTGFVVPPRDPAALAGAIARFFGEGWGERMAPFFAAEKERFSWSAMVRSLDELAKTAKER